MRLPSRAAYLALILAALLALAAWQWPDGQLHVRFPALPGDAALIQTPSGGSILIDGGADPAALAAALGRFLPFWKRSLDMVILTRADGQHLPGQVAALARYRVPLAIAPARMPRGAEANEWRRLLGVHGAEVRVARPGMRLDAGGAALRVLAAGESGVVLRLDYGATSVVFAHGAAAGQGAALATSGALRPASLVTFPWQDDPRTPFLAALRPAAILFTDGQDADGAAELTFAERAVGGAAPYHERLHGTVEWVSDGRSAAVRSVK
jgi:hypothetical protein